jgi:hypothetical protein
MPKVMLLELEGRLWAVGATLALVIAVVTFLTVLIV